MAAAGENATDETRPAVSSKFSWKCGAAAATGNKSFAHLVKAAQVENERQERRRAAEVLAKMTGKGSALLKPGWSAVKGKMDAAKEKKEKVAQMAKEGRFLELLGMFFGSIGSYIKTKTIAFWDGLRSEHAIVSFLYPHEEETTVLTDPQVAQIFWNMLMVENMVLAMLYENDEDGPLISIKVIILIFIATGICTGCGMFCRLVFRWGNKGKRFKRKPREKKAHNKDLQRALLAAEKDGVPLSDAERMRIVYRNAKAAKKKKMTLRECLDRTRLATAWVINILFYLIMVWFIITYAMLFGKEETKGWLMSWCMASGNAWIVVEPMEVLILVMMPFLFDNECVANCRTTAKELGII